MEIADSLDRCVGTERATASASSAPLGAAALYARLQVGDSGDAEEPAPPVLARAQTRIAQLESFDASLTAFRGHVTSALDALQRVDDLKVQIDSSAGELSSANELLQHEAVELDRTRESLKESLVPFDQLDQLVGRLGLSPGAAGTATTLRSTEEFVDVLDKLVHVEKFFAEHPQFRDSAAALKTCGQLRKRSLAMAKSQVTDALNLAVRSALGQPTDKLESSSVYIRFSGVAEKVNKIVLLMHRYANDDDAVLEECRQLYCGQRLALLRQVVTSFFADVSASQGVMGVARLGSAFLGRVCALEQQLFESWFACGENDAPLEEGDSLGDMLFELCSTMYNYLRPFLIHEVELDVLCQLIAVIQEEAAALGVGGTAAEGQSTTGKIIGSVLSRLVQDAQERLIFCSITLIRDEVEQYAPTSLDLDYPQRLAATAKVANGNGGASADAAAADAPPSEQGELFASWYAPLRSTLMILSKIYRAVDIIVFEDLAQQAVGACLEALQRAAQMITTNKGAVDGDLFLVKHLLVLREQLTPFDISLSATKRRLDFASTRGAFSRFVADRHNLFRWSAENALFTLARDGIPRVNEDRIDSKKELEEVLKVACGRFVSHTTGTLAEPIITFNSKARAFSTSASQLGAQPFAQPERIGETLDKAAALITDGLPKLTQSMALYLGNAVTQSILLKPVQSRTRKALQEMRETLAGLPGDFDRVLETISKGIELA